MNFKLEKFQKLHWLKNASEYGGAMKMVIDSAPQNNIILNSVTKMFGRMWTDTTPDNLLKLTQKDYGLYEVISFFPHKVYFDIDYKGPHDTNLLNILKEGIKEIFIDAEFAISGSITENKTSYHIILSNYIIKDDENDRPIIKGIVRYLNENVSSSFDVKVYTNNRNMKTINQSKGDGRIQKIIENSDIKCHMITCFISNDAKNLPEFNFDDELNEELDEEPKIKIKREKKQKLINTIDIEKASNKFNIGNLPNMNLIVPEKFDINKVTPIELLNMIPLDISFDHSYTHYICRFCYFNNLTFDNFYQWYSQKQNSTAIKKKWVKNHWPFIKAYPEVTIENIIFLLSKFYPNIRQSQKLRTFVDQFNLPSENIIKVDRISQDAFKTDNKFIIINSGMGSGKTAQTIDKLKHLKQDENFLWMTPNVALAQNTHHRMTEENNIKCCYYKDTTLFKSSQDKFKLNNYDNLIICINSLHYLKPDKKQYKYVIIDEIETLLIKWHNNNTFNEKANYKIDCWNNFLSIIKNAEKVILLDAFTTNKTLNFIKNLCGYQKYDIYELNDKNYKRDIYFIEKFQNFLYEIIQNLKDDKKIYIFYPYKGKSRYLPSMASFVDILTNETNKKGCFYNADVDDKTLKTLADVNTNWQNYNFVVTNTKINVGLNFEVVHFHKVYACLAGYNISRDVIQATYRCRTLIDNSIHICFVDKINTNLCFKNDAADVDNCQIYKKLVSDILIEKQAPLISSFNLIASKAHYKICSDDKTISIELIKRMNKLLKNTNNISYNFNSLPNYNYEDVKTVEKKLYALIATLEEKLAITKYYFKLKFIDNVDEQLLASAWDNRYVFFMDKLLELKYNEDNIFKKIQTHNKWSSIFPTEEQLNKNTIDTKIRDEIFNEYHFTKITKEKATSNVIIKNIYNAFFNKNIIMSIKKTTKNYKMSFPDEVYEMYQFGMSNLRMSKNNVIDIDDPFIDDDKIEIQMLNLLDNGINNIDDEDDEIKNIVVEVKPEEPITTKTIEIIDEVVKINKKQKIDANFFCLFGDDD
jgi:Ni2+-binding GTPase involved in maturation of urease and hydrogenase